MCCGGWGSTWWNSPTHPRGAFYETEVTTIGSSKGVILPKKLLEALNVKKGDLLYVTATATGGILLSPYEPDFDETVQLAGGVMKRYRPTLRKLAK